MASRGDTQEHTKNSYRISTTKRIQKEGDRELEEIQRVDLSAHQYREHDL